MFTYFSSQWERSNKLAGFLAESQSWYAIDRKTSYLPCSFPKRAYRLGILLFFKSFPKLTVTR